MYTLVAVEGTKIKAVGNCMITAKRYETQPFESSDYEEWKTGEHQIQDTGLRTLSADDREFLINSVSPYGWESLAGI